MREKLRQAGLFSKIALVVVAGVAAVSICTMVLALRATERSYVETLSLSNRQVLDGVEADMESANDMITRLMLCMGSSTAFRGYLTSDGANPTAFRQVYTMTVQLSAISPVGGYDAVAVNSAGTLRYANNETDLALPAGELLESDLTDRARAEPHRIHYRFLDAGITNRSADGAALVAVKALTWPGSSTAYGYGFVVVRQADLQDFYNKMSTPANTLLLVDPEGTVVSATDQAWVGRRSDDLNAALTERGEAGLTPTAALVDGRAVTLQSKLMPQWDLRLVTVLDQGRALREMSGRTDVVLVCALVCAAVLTAVFLLLRQITKPIHDLVQTMHNATPGGLTEHVPVRGGSEARELAVAFNAMLDDVQDHVDRLMALEQDKRGMELEALQMQIKPHFIYNTLTSIKWLIWQKEGDKAARCIDALTLLLRSTLGNQRELITAGEEVDTLKSYVFLQQIRYGDRIRVTYYLPDEAADCLLPKLLLQPLVENAFFHAFTDRPGGGTISVFLARQGEDLVCEVMDDGVGMSAETVERVLSGGPREPGGRPSGIGIANVDQRLKLLYGPKYGVRVFSKPGEGTTVRAALPAAKGEQPQAEKVPRAEEITKM